jgi:hypothetical protein
LHQLFSLSKDLQAMKRWIVAASGCKSSPDNLSSAYTLEMAALRRRGNCQLCGQMAVQNYLAAKMRVSQQQVSKLLAGAERAMQYFEERSIWAAWVWSRNGLRLNAPVAGQDR